MILVDTSVWVHLLVSATLTDGARLWSRYRRLAELAAELHIAFSET